MFDFISFNIILWLGGFFLLFGIAALLSNPIPVIGGILVMALLAVAAIKLYLVLQAALIQKDQIALKKDGSYCIKGTGHPVKIVRYEGNSYWFYDPVDKKFISPAWFVGIPDDHYGENDVENRYDMLNSNMHSRKAMNKYLKSKETDDTEHVLELFSYADRWSGENNYDEHVFYKLGASLAKATLGPVFMYKKENHDKDWNMWYTPDMEKAITKRMEARQEITDMLRRFDELMEKYPVYDEAYHNKLRGHIRVNTENKGDQL